MVPEEGGRLQGITWPARSKEPDSALDLPVHMTLCTKPSQFEDGDLNPATQTTLNNFSNTPPEDITVELSLHP